jgi:hypothetical protein
MKTVYVIFGTSRYGTEEIDFADSREEAKRLTAEYRIAFGPGWAFKIVTRKEDPDA